MNEQQKEETLSASDELRRKADLLEVVGMATYTRAFELQFAKDLRRIADQISNLSPSESKEERPKLICYCGSLRFIDEFKKSEYQSLLDGNIALLPCCMFVDIQREYSEGDEYKLKADKLHKRKIDICDEVFVLNVGGYIGNSTRSEINYAISINKPVKYLENGK